MQTTAESSDAMLMPKAPTNVSLTSDLFIFIDLFAMMMFHFWSVFLNPDCFGSPETGCTRQNTSLVQVRVTECTILSLQEISVEGSQDQEENIYLKLEGTTQTFQILQKTLSFR